MTNLFETEKDSKNVVLKSNILCYFIQNGNSTTNDLAKEFNLSIPTMAKTIAELTAGGYVLEYGKLETGEGRRPNLYGLNPDSGYFIGVDMKQDALCIGLMNFRGDLIDLIDNEPFLLANTQASLDELCDHIARFIKHIKVPREKVFNININISGRVNPDTGYSYSIFNFSEIPLSTYISERVDCDVSIDNDSRAMAYGEYMQGCAKGEKNVLFLNASWGIGLGMIIDGNLYKGKSGFAGEFGHIHAFDNEILCHCGKKGCLETEASGSAFDRIFKERIKNGETSILKTKNGEEITLHDLVKATNQEDPLCIDILERIGHNLGMYVAGLINLFNPELVILGGTLSLTGDFILHAVRSAVLKYSLNLVNKDTQIRISKLKDRAGVVGACMLARNNVLQ